MSHRIIIDNGIKRGSFKGEPEGFINLPKDSLFMRKNYRYWTKLKNEAWNEFTGMYYKPNLRTILLG